MKINLRQTDKDYIIPKKDVEIIHKGLLMGLHYCSMDKFATMKEFNIIDRGIDILTGKDVEND